MTTGTKDYYQILGVSEKAEADEIRKAYRKLAKQYHPDANQGDPSAAARFKEVGEAYAVLSDEEKRKQYDQMRKLGLRVRVRAGGRGPRPGGAGGPGGFRPGVPRLLLRGPGGAGRPGGSLLRPSSTGDARAPGGAGAGPQPGEDVEVSAEISFETAVRGETSPPGPRHRALRHLRRFGGGPGSGLRNCGECGGVRHRLLRSGRVRREAPLPGVHGAGPHPRDPLSLLWRAGSVRQVRKLQVNVPPGWNRSRLRSSGRGRRAPRVVLPGI
jgi:molecular chaperone DnaJ